MAKLETDSATLSGNDQLQRRAERARETERLALEAEAEANRLRKEAKRVRKAYKEAKQVAKEAAKTANKARTELSSCLEGAFRQLATAVQDNAAIQAKTSADKLPAGTPGYAAGTGEVLLLPGSETHTRATASG